MATTDPPLRRTLWALTGGVLLGSAGLQLIYGLAGRWHWRVLLGTLLGTAAAVGNLWLLGVTLQTALSPPGWSPRRVAVAQWLRALGMLAAACLGAALGAPGATLLPLLFPRVLMALWPLRANRRREEERP